MFKCCSRLQQPFPTFQEASRTGNSTYSIGRESNRKAVPANRMGTLAFLSPPRHTEGSARLSPARSSAVSTVAYHSNARAWGGGPGGIQLSALCQALHAGAQRDVDSMAHWGIRGECMQRQLRYVITIIVIVIMLYTSSSYLGTMVSVCVFRCMFQCFGVEGCREYSARWTGAWNPCQASWMCRVASPGRAGPPDAG